MTESEQAATGITRFEERIELFFGLPTIEQLARCTEQQHVGWRLAIDFFCPLVLVRVLRQLLLDDALVVQLQEQGEHVGRTNEVGTDLVDLEVDGTAVGEQQLVTQLLHCWRRTTVEGEGVCTSTPVFTLQTFKFFVLVAAIAKGTFVSQFCKMRFRHDWHRVFHEPLLEALDELILHDVHGVALAESRSGKSEGIEVDRNVTTILRDDGCPHVAGDLRQEVSHFSAEEPPVGILGLVAEHFGDLFDCRVVLDTCHVDHD